MSSLAHRRLRAPEADGIALIDPPLAEVPAIIAANRAAASDRDQKLGMRSGFCAAARRMLLRADGSEQASQTANDVDRPAIMAGHQPTLFHPGVWFKNFLLSSISRSVGGNAVNLVVDSDVAGTPGIRVPTGGSQDARLIDVLFDAPGDAVPWEERHLLDTSTFESFSRRVHDAYAKSMTAKRTEPLLIDRLWPCAEDERERQVVNGERVFREAAARQELDTKLVRSLSEPIARPGHCLAAARHRLEHEAGLATHDVPLGAPSFWFHFAYFAELLIRRHEELQAIHNAAVAQYRAVNRIRSRSHPVPDLVRDGNWVEVPLWLWSHRKPRRRRVFARKFGTNWEITDREGIIVRPAAGASADGPLLFESAELQGIKLRPRALITTMYSRLVLSDLFIHGIGGAKYDELTDEIIRRFFGIEPPRYLTATATFRLPIDRPQVTIDDVRNAARLVRDVRYRPETLVGHPLVASDAALERELQALAAQKREYVRSHTLRKAAHDVFAGLDRINESLREKLQPLEKHLRAEHARLVGQLKQARLLGSREFSFVLYPEEYLVPRLLALAAAEK